MKIAAQLLLILALLAPPAQPSATLVATWSTPQALRVQWSANEPGCLVLVGNTPPQRLEVPCAASGDVTLPTGGVDQAYAPQRRTHVELRAQSDLTRVLARVRVPARYQLALPLILAS